MRRTRTAIATMALLISLNAKAGQPPSPAPDVKSLITADFIASTREWLSHPIVALSIKAQTAKRGAITQANIDALDQQWRAERKADDKPLISSTLSAPLSVYLLRIQAESTGLYYEIFVTDANGLNVGQSAVTSDYWQGDEAKFQKTFSVAPDAVFVDEPEWDEALKIWRAQLNLTVTDAHDGKSIGAATVEVNLTELQRRNGTTS